MSDHILISGVTGFVGRPLTAKLDAAGYVVSGLSRDSVAACKRVPALRDAYDWRTDRVEPQHEAFEGLRAVVHLAGEPVTGRWTQAKKKRIEESRLKGTRRIVDAIEHAEVRPKVLVSASAVGFYGPRGDEELTEDAGSGDDFLARVCVGWEREAQRAAALGVRVVCLRIGLVMGAGGGALDAMLPLFKLGLGGKIGSGRQFWPWIHLDDLIRLIERAIADEGMEGPYNAVAPHPVRQAEFARVLAKVLHRPAFLPAPELAVKTALGGFAAELLNSRRAIPQRALEAGFVFHHDELEDALAAVVGG